MLNSITYVLAGYGVFADAAPNYWWKLEKWEGFGLGRVSSYQYDIGHGVTSIASSVPSSDFAARVSSSVGADILIHVLSSSSCCREMMRSIKK